MALFFIIIRPTDILNGHIFLMNTSFCERQGIIICAKYWNRHRVLWKRRCNRRWTDEEENCERRSKRDWCIQIMQKLVRENSWSFLVWFGKEEEKIYKLCLGKVYQMKIHPIYSIVKTREIYNNEEWLLERQL